MNKHNRAWQLCVGFLLAVLAFGGQAQTQTVVESVSSSIQGGVEVIQGRLLHPLVRCRAGAPSRRPRASRGTYSRRNQWAGALDSGNQPGERALGNVVQRGSGPPRANLKAHTPTVRSWSGNH